MIRYYFASRYSNNKLMREYRDILEKTVLNCEVTSRWIDQHGGMLLNSLVSEKLNSYPDECWEYGQKDLDDIDEENVVVSFTGEGGKGGRHVEYGYGLATGKRMIIVGSRENVFHTHPHVEHYYTFEEFLEHEKEA